MYVETAPQGGLRILLDRHEAAVLRQVTNEMIGLLEEDALEEEVAERLFPDAYESPSDARAFRELVGDELKSHKLRALETIQRKLGKGGSVVVPLVPEEVQAWLRGITDIRLAAGTRLDVTEDKMAAPIDPGDPQAALLAVMHWLGWLQESILEKIDS